MPKINVYSISVINIFNVPRKRLGKGIHLPGTRINLKSILFSPGAIFYTESLLILHILEVQLRIMPSSLTEKEHLVKNSS
jgi:hypothetical protein